MKRLLTITILISTLSISAFAQTDKGWRSVGGSGMLRLDFTTPTNTYFGLAPEIYWFVADKFAIGTDFGFGFNSSKTNDSTSFNGVDAYVTPGLRYYFRDVEKKWRPYGFLNGGFEVYANTSRFNYISTKSSGSGFRGYAGLGLAWFFNEHAAFDIRLHAFDYTRNDIEFNPTFTIGIQAFFHHD